MSQTGGRYNWPAPQLLNASYEIGGSVLIDDFSNLASWTTATSDATLAGVSESSQYVKYGTKSLKFRTAAAGSQNASITKDVTFNLTARPGFWVFGYKPFNLASGVSTGRTWYLSHQTALGSGAGRWQTASVTLGIPPGWFAVFMQQADWSVLDGTPDFANDILSWRFRIDSLATEVREFYLDSAHFLRTRPKIVISFDDGWDSSYYYGHSYAQQNAVPLTHYLIGGSLGTAGYITSSQAEKMKYAGDYIGVHGNSSWASGGLSTILSDINRLGSLTDAKHASWPNGDYGGHTYYPSGFANSAAAGFLTNRSVEYNVVCPLSYNPHALSAIPLNNTVTLVQAKALVDKAVAGGGTVVFYGHKLGAAADSLTWVTTDYNALIDYIVAKRAYGMLDTVTIADWYGGLAGGVAV